MSDSDPSRLSDSTDALGELFRNAERDLPADAELARLRARLPPAFSGNAPSAVRPGLSNFGRAGLGVLVVGAVVLVGYLATRSMPPVAAPVVPSAAPPTVSDAVKAPPVEASATEPSADPVPTPSVAAPTSASAAKPPRDKISEATLLEQARRALVSNPAQALALTRRHQALYPNGALTQEREVIAIEALRKLGASSQASERANDFQHEFPDSAHRRTVEKGLGPK